MQYVGQAASCFNGSRGYEVHIKDVEGYEMTIAGPGMTEEEAKQFTDSFNATNKVSRK